MYSFSTYVCTKGFYSFGVKCICISVIGKSPFFNARFGSWNHMLTYPSNDHAILINEDNTNIWEMKCTRKNGCIWKKGSVKIKSNKKNNSFSKVGIFVPVPMFVNSTFFDAQDE